MINIILNGRHIAGRAHSRHLQSGHQFRGLRAHRERIVRRLTQDLQRVLAIRGGEQLRRVYPMRRRRVACPGAAAQLAVARRRRRRRVQQPPAILRRARPADLPHGLLRDVGRSTPLDLADAGLAVAD